MTLSCFVVNLKLVAWDTMFSVMGITDSISVVYWYVFRNSCK